MILNFLRNKLFWLLDVLKGNRIRNQLKEIEFGVKQPKSKKAIQIKKDYLECLLKHATQTVPFYRDYREVKSIKDFPVIRKTIIQDDFNAFQSIKYVNKSNFKVSTSGSTGVPFFLFQNNLARYLHVVILCSSEKATHSFNLLKRKTVKNSKSATAGDYSCIAEKLCVKKIDATKLRIYKHSQRGSMFMFSAADKSLLGEVVFFTVQWLCASSPFDVIKITFFFHWMNHNSKETYK